MDGGTLGLNLAIVAPDGLSKNMQVIVYVTYSSDINLKGSEVITKTF